MPISIEQFEAFQKKYAESEKANVLLENKFSNEKETAKKIKSKLSKLKRSAFNANDIGRLDEELKRTESRINNLGKEYAKSSRDLSINVHEFREVLNPRYSVNFLNKDYPILMLPLRLETRFKKLSEDRHQLWLRVFPDDCSLDSFEPTLSESEIKRAESYWCAYYAAGDLVNNNEEINNNLEVRRKAAWKVLASGIQPGRADYIRKQYSPLENQNLKAKNSVEDVILTIPYSEEINDAVSEKLGVYWRQYFIANGDGIKISSAFDEFKKDLDPAYASELIKSYVPINLNEKVVTNAEKVSVRFLQFKPIGDVDSRQTSWTKAIKATLLPERLTITAYNKMGNEFKEVLYHLGNIIPDPLIVGPDPSMDTNAELLKALLDEYRTLLTREQKLQKLERLYDETKEEVVISKTISEFVNEYIDLSDAELDGKFKILFSNIKDEVKAAYYIEYLKTHAETKWLFDFDEAIKVGMGFKIDISEADYRNGFERLFVNGVVLKYNTETAKKKLENLLKNNQNGTSGFAIVTQGTPTNNSDEGNSGYTEFEDPDLSYNRYNNLSALSADINVDFENFTDGDWLTYFLGLDKAAISNISNYNATDINEAKAMNTALWNSTMGYYMHSMVQPVFDAQDIANTSKFFTNFVSGRGLIPSVRIDDQPYSILPISNYNSLHWNNIRTGLPLFNHENLRETINAIHKVLNVVANDWMPLTEKISYLGKEKPFDGDGATLNEIQDRTLEENQHKLFMDALTLHAQSVDFYHRNANSWSHKENQMKLAGVCLDNIKKYKEDQVKLGLAFLKEKFGYEPKAGEELDIISKLFFEENSFKDIPILIDDQALSEENKVRTYTVDQKNYIQWLWENIQNDYEKFKNETDFSDGRPNALLYLLLRQSILLGYADTVYETLRGHGLLSNSEVKKFRSQPDMYGIKPNENVITQFERIESSAYPVVTEGKPFSTFILEKIANRDFDFFTASNSNLLKITDSLEKLKEVPTARLERLLVEHLDLMSHRLDAWIQGLVNLQLVSMRQEYSRNQTLQRRKGIYLGAFGWLLDVKPSDTIYQKKSFESRNENNVDVEHAHLKKIFQPEKEEILIDYNNEGYIHALSINHANTAAVLRNSYISNSIPANPDLFKVNLSSERIRKAMHIIEGMQQGQSLGALLGYQFERKLHESYNSMSNEGLDSIIYELRLVFPLYANHLNATFEDDESLEINQIEARNVVDGLKLAQSYKDTTLPAYSAIKAIIDNLDQARKTFLLAALDKLLDTLDALADLSTAENVHQMMQGNFDRLGGNIETYSTGSFPQIPEVVKTPNSGISITQRVGLHFDTTYVISESATPRVITEPSIEAFLKENLPELVNIHCFFEIYKNEVDDQGKVRKDILLDKKVTFDELNIFHSDLFYISKNQETKNLTTLDDLILNYAISNLEDSELLLCNDPDNLIEINYQKRDTNLSSIPFFEFLPLLNSLRVLILNSRPLRPSDMALPGEAKNEMDVSLSYIPSGFDTAFIQFKAARTLIDELAQHSFNINFNLENFELTLSNSDNIILNIDSYIADYIEGMIELSLFGIEHSGFGFIHDRKKEIYSKVSKKVLDLKKRWEDKMIRYDELVMLLDTAVSPEERIDILRRMERQISTSYIFPIEADFESKVVIKRDKFITKFSEIENWLSTPKVLLSGLSVSTGLFFDLKENMGEYDLIDLDIQDEIKQVVILGEDLIANIQKTKKALDDKKIKIEDHLSKEKIHEAAKEMLGNEFLMLPRFTLSLENKSEIENSLGNQTGLLKFQINEIKSLFPIDDWLYGTGRVREKMNHLENFIIQKEELSSSSNFELKAVQLPYNNNDPWLALEYPQDFEIENDKLLYTSNLSVSSFEGQHFCGLLIDEWTEIIPSKLQTTGIAFHYNQPNSEPPQTMLLVTPSADAPKWKWEDIPDAMHAALDLAKLRAIEPKHFSETFYAQMLPMTIGKVVHPVYDFGLNLMMASQKFQLIKDN